jgi:peptidoglycan/LPS O-acetylase OafA/YrhL
VLLGHLSGTPNFGVVPKVLGDLAHLGVIVFFAISGFLITTLLLAEDARHGRVSLRLFYGRRALRIFPPLYLYLGVVALLGGAGYFTITNRDYWYSVLYLVNYLPERSWQIGHLWSLSVEEQFYLLWPFAFVALGARRSVWAAWSMLLVAPLSRLLVLLYLRDSPYKDAELFSNVADSLAAGCLLAILRVRLERQNWYVRLLGPWPSVMLLAMVLCVNRFDGYGAVRVVGATIVNVGLAVLIHRSVYHWQDRAGTLLQWRPLASVGVISYSLYLWQQLFVNRYGEHWINRFPQNLVLSVIAAVTSYLLVEKPCQSLRRHLRPQARTS